MSMTVPDTTDHAVDMKKVTLAYGTQTLRFPDWSVTHGQHALILGPSGSGKTSLLHLLGGLLRPTGGQLRVTESDLSGMNEKRLDVFRRQNIGIVFQVPHLIQSLTVLENIKMAILLSRRKKEAISVHLLADALAISEILNKKTTQISQGQAQRVAIARALIHRPKILLADEPTASLDDENCERVINLLRGQSDQYGATLIIATHDSRVKSAFKETLEL